MRKTKLLTIFILLILVVCTTIQPVSADEPTEAETKELAKALTDSIGSGEGKAGGSGSGTMVTSQTGYRFYLAKSHAGTEQSKDTMQVVSNAVDVVFNSSAKSYAPNTVNTRVAYHYPWYINAANNRIDNNEKNLTVITVSQLNADSDNRLGNLPTPIYHNGTFVGNGAQLREWMDSTHTVSCLGLETKDAVFAGINSQSFLENPYFSRLYGEIYKALLDEVKAQAQTMCNTGTSDDGGYSTFTAVDAKSTLLRGLSAAKKKYDPLTVAFKVIEKVESLVGDIVDDTKPDPGKLGWKPKASLATSNSTVYSDTTHLENSLIADIESTLSFAYADEICTCRTDIANKEMLIFTLTAAGYFKDAGGGQIETTDILNENLILIAEPIIWFVMDNGEAFYGTPTEFAELYTDGLNNNELIDDRHDTTMFKTLSVCLFLDQDLTHEWCANGNAGGDPHFTNTVGRTSLGNTSGRDALNTYTDGYAMHAYRFDGGKAYILEFHTEFNEYGEPVKSWTSNIIPVDTGKITLDGRQIYNNGEELGYLIGLDDFTIFTGHYNLYEHEILNEDNRPTIDGYIDDVEEGALIASLADLEIQLYATYQNIARLDSRTLQTAEVTSQEIELDAGQLLVLNTVAGVGGGIVVEYYGSYMGEPSETYLDNTPTFNSYRVVPAYETEDGGLNYTIEDVTVTPTGINGSELEVDNKTLVRNALHPRFQQEECGEYSAQEYFMVDGNFIDILDYIINNLNKVSTFGTLELRNYDTIRDYGKYKSAGVAEDDWVVNLKDPALDPKKRTVTFEEFELGESNVQTLVVLYLKEDKPEIDLIEFTEDYTTEPFTFDSTHSEIEWEKDKKYDILNNGDFLVEEYFLINKPIDALGWTTISFC